MKPWLAWAILAFTLHFIWEMGQARWYASMQGLPFWTATLLCLRAAAADLGITAVLYVLTAGVFRDRWWVIRSRWAAPGALFTAVGIFVTVAIELWATSTGRWSYAANMPAIGRIGLLPLLQWIVVPMFLIMVMRLVNGVGRLSAEQS